MRSKRSVLKEIETLLMRGRIKASLNLLNQFDVDEKLRNSIEIQQGRLSDLERDIADGTISDDSSNTRRNQIRKATLLIKDEIRQYDYSLKGHFGIPILTNRNLTAILVILLFSFGAYQCNKSNPDFFSDRFIPIQPKDTIVVLNQQPSPKAPNEPTKAPQEDPPSTRNANPIIEIPKPQLPLSPRAFKISKNKEIYVPHADFASADEVVSFQQGTPNLSLSSGYRRQHATLGSPDKKALTLGCGGSIVLKFTDNGLVNIDGPDLYIFEAGDNFEGFTVEISENGRDWRNLGEMTHKEQTFEIGSPSTAGKVYYYVRITDRRYRCNSGKWSGAEIDAVVAIGSQAPSTNNSDGLIGSWEGYMDRPGLSPNLTKITLYQDGSGSIAGTIEHPEMPYVGQLELIYHTGSTYTFAQKKLGASETDRTQLIYEGGISLTRIWYDASSGKEGSRGTLRKVR